MKLQVLGTGCAKCKVLYQNAQEAVSSLGLDAEVEKVEDIQQIMSYNILMTPGLVIDGYVKVAGRLPKLDEVKRLILAAKAA